MPRCPQPAQPPKAMPLPPPTRHSLGVQQLIVAVNKLDNVDYSQVCA